MSIFKKDGGFFHTLIKFISGKNTADSVVDSANSWLDAQTGRALTGAQQQQNQFNAEQAQMSRDWSEQMDNTKYQRSVADMKAAGVNPALAMSGGVTAPPSLSTASSGSSNSVASMSDIMSLILGKKQGRLIDAQAQQARDQGEAAKTHAEAALINANTGIRGQDLREKEFESVTQPLALNTIRVGSSIVKLNDKQSYKVSKEIGLLREDITLAQLREIATAMDIIWQGETWDDSKRMLASQIAKNSAEAAYQYAMSKNAGEEYKKLVNEAKWSDIYYKYWSDPKHSDRGVNIEMLRGTNLAAAGVAYIQAFGDNLGNNDPGARFVPPQDVDGLGR